MGLPGCGVTIAAHVAQTSLAPVLFQATQELPCPALSHFLEDWRKQLKSELLFNKQNMLKRAYPAIASRINNEFPSIDTLHLYVHPCTSWTQGNGDQLLREHWVCTAPNLAALGVLCETFFSWGTSCKVLDHFRKYLWPGICSRYLMEVC